MFRMVLLRSEYKLVKDRGHRKKVFKKKCKIREKSCDLIIDRGSIYNLMSIEVQRKLNLRCIPHLNPYRFSWLKKGQQVIVTEQCLLSF